jgi:SAM-dependent methyltransferase
MSPLAAEMARAQGYIRASRPVVNWIAGARALALLSTAIDAGLIDALRRAATVDELQSATGLEAEGVVDICRALEAHGVARRTGERYGLTREFELLAAPDAAIPLADVVRHAMATIRGLQVGAADATYTSLAPTDVLAMAAGAGISSLSSSSHVSTEVLARALPEVDAIWRQRAHHLEVGCGIGNALLGTVSTYPTVTAVGVEIDEATAAEARRRAMVLGVADRVDVRCMDACDIDDDAAFDTVQWSQFFFPGPTRPTVLAAIGRALKPGGYLVMPWLGSVSPDTMPRRRTTLRLAIRAMRSGPAASLPFLMDLAGDTPSRRRKERWFASLTTLLFHRWGVPVLSVGELASEVRSSGLSVLRCTPMLASQFVLTRGLLLAQRPPIGSTGPNRLEPPHPAN